MSFYWIVSYIACGIIQSFCRSGHTYVLILLYISRLAWDLISNLSTLFSKSLIQYWMFNGVRKNDASRKIKTTEICMYQCCTFIGNSIQSIFKRYLKSQRLSNFLFRRHAQTYYWNYVQQSFVTGLNLNQFYQSVVAKQYLHHDLCAKFPANQSIHKQQLAICFLFFEASSMKNKEPGKLSRCSYVTISQGWISSNLKC